MNEYYINAIKSFTRQEEKVKRIFCIAFLVMLGWQPSMADVTSGLEEARKSWINAFNSRSNDIRTLYIKPCGLLFNDLFLFGREKVAERLLLATSTIEAAHVLGVSKNDEMDYIEIGYYDTPGSDAKRLYYITAWHNVAPAGEIPQWRRELDVMCPQKSDSTDVPPLEVARRQWEELAMKHDTLALVQHLYAEDATYFNGGRADTGHQAIASRFLDIMTDSSFSIELEPKHVVRVQPEYAFEVGYYTERHKKFRIVRRMFFPP
jgi:hypothetical protein